LQAWVKMNWDELDQKFKQLLAWDPDRWSLLKLAETITAFRLWLKRLYEGPDPGTSALDFIKSMQEEQPPLQKVLGQPPWFQSLSQMLSNLTQDTSKKPSLDAVKNWCPWVLKHTEIFQTREAVHTDENKITQTLSHFERHVQAWSDIDAGLVSVKAQSPEYHPTCRKLIGGFTQALSLNFDRETISNLYTKPPHPALEKTCQVLGALINWRTQLSMGVLEKALEEVCTTSLKDWQIIQQACEITRRWQTNIMPALCLILEEEFDSIDNINKLHNEILLDIAKQLAGIKETWAQIYLGVFHKDWLVSLEQSIDKVRTLFLSWRNEQEQSDNRLERILYHSQLDPIRQISSRLLELSQHIRLIRLNFTELEQNQKERSQKMNTIDRILGHLAVIEDVLVQEPDLQKVPDWQSDLDRVRDTGTSEDRRKVVLSLSSDHPLYTWLVDSTF
ncbi:MAG: hypothetical protein ACOCYU_08060, partial [Brevefilum sp.]